jgi:hypothetical protein
MSVRRAFNPLTVSNKNNRLPHFCDFHRTACVYIVCNAIVNHSRPGEAIGRLHRCRGAPRQGTSCLHARH